MSQETIDYGIEKSLKNLGIFKENNGVSSGGNYFANGDLLESYSPTDGKLIAKIKSANTEDYNKVIETAKSAYQEFRMIPAPKRGELVRQFGLKLREYKDDLGKLVSYEMGKS
ncbi:MAG: aldehyde dehydrogenase family protein, partial [Kaistella sp.]